MSLRKKCSRPFFRVIIYLKEPLQKYIYVLNLQKKLFADFLNKGTYLFERIVLICAGIVVYSS